MSLPDYFVKSVKKPTHPFDHQPLFVFVHPPLFVLFSGARPSSARSWKQLVKDIVTMDVIPRDSLGAAEQPSCVQKGCLETIPGQRQTG